LGEQADLVQHDWYYHDLTHLSRDARDAYNYDHPGALETALMVQHLDRLRSGETVSRPGYDFSCQARTVDAAQILPRPVLVVEGIMVLQDAALRARMDLKVFVDTAAPARLTRRIHRDTRERGTTETQTRRMFSEHVKPMHDEHVEPSRTHADLVIPNGYNPATVAILIAALKALAAPQPR